MARLDAVGYLCAPGRLAALGLLCCGRRIHGPQPPELSHLDHVGRANDLEIGHESGGNREVVVYMATESQIAAMSGGAISGTLSTDPGWGI